MQRVRIQPELGSGSTLQYSTFRSLLQGTAGADLRDCSGRWPVGGGQVLLELGGRNRRRRHSVASCLRRVGDELEPRTHGGIHLPVAGAQAGEAQARWHRYRGALRGESPRTGEGRTAVIRDS